MISNVNNLKANTKAYVRVWRPDASYQLQGEDLPAPPPSLSMILSRAQNGYGGLTQAFTRSWRSWNRWRRRRNNGIENDPGEIKE